MKSEEETTSVPPDLIVKMRSKLLNYFRDIARMTVGERDREVLGGVQVGRVKKATGWSPESVIVIDGGSNVIPLNIGFIGVCGAVAVMMEGGRVVGRLISEPEVIPPDPRDLSAFDSVEALLNVLDKMREAMVFELSTRVLKHCDPEFIVIDGPGVPYRALMKQMTETQAEAEALDRYKKSVVNFLLAVGRRETNVIGFVKRPVSMFLHRLGIVAEKSFDHVILSRLLSPGEFSPHPPESLPINSDMIPDPQILAVIEGISPTFTFLRMTEATPPYRVDFVSLNIDHGDLLSYLYQSKTREGIPYPIMKADEEAKISRKLVRELYSDALHAFVRECVGKLGVRVSLTPVLPVYGEW